MITTIIICITILVCLFMVLKWAHDMSTASLPMFTYGECIQKDSDEQPAPVTQPIGFAPAEEEEKPGDKTDREQKEAVLKDPITMFSALLRGEVDIDDVTN